MVSEKNYNFALHNKIDTIGLVASVVCAVHCIAFPLLVVILPLIGLNFMLDLLVEKVFVIATISLAAFNLCWGYRIHRRRRVLMMFAAASIMVITGVFILPHSHTVADDDHIWSQTTPTHEIHQSSLMLPGHHVESPRPQDNPFGLILLIVGAGAIAASHWTNRYFCKSCHCCQKHHKDQA